MKRPYGTASNSSSPTVTSPSGVWPRRYTPLAVYVLLLASQLTSRAAGDGGVALAPDPTRLASSSNNATYDANCPAGPGGLSSQKWGPLLRESTKSGCFASRLYKSVVPHLLTPSTWISGRHRTSVCAPRASAAACQQGEAMLGSSGGVSVGSMANTSGEEATMSAWRGGNAARWAAHMSAGGAAGPGMPSNEPEAGTSVTGLLLSNEAAPFCVPLAGATATTAAACWYPAARDMTWSGGWPAAPKCAGATWRSSGEASIPLPSCPFPLAPHPSSPPPASAASEKYSPAATADTGLMSRGGALTRAGPAGRPRRVTPAFLPGR